MHLPSYLTIAYMNVVNYYGRIIQAQFINHLS